MTRNIMNYHYRNQLCLFILKKIERQYILYYNLSDLWITFEPSVSNLCLIPVELTILNYFYFKQKKSLNRKKPITFIGKEVFSIVVHC